MTRPWWQSAVIYQIYPRSFADSDGDGVGDLAGIVARLDYLVDLGIDALWISPIFPSPMADFGYDVANYRGIDPRFGTLADFDALLAEAHRRGLRVLLDLVPNHTSDQHPWFVDSRSSRDSPKRDWYLWRDAAPDGGLPNNWISDFGGPAWEWDEATGQYYCHAFLKEQPDLNWREPAVAEAIGEAMRFWFDRGVDGFRIDVLWHMVKRADFADNPPNPDWRPEMGDKDRVLQLHSTDQPEVHDIAADMRALADSYAGDRVLIGEIYLPVDELVRYYGEGRPEVHLPFNFQLIDLPWEARAIAEAIRAYEAALPDGAWPNWVLGNHDRPRIATRVGEAQARVAAMLLLTLRGTPTLYYGDEIGLTDAAIPPDRVQDPRELREPGLGLGRDPVRAPMPWNDAPNAGFSAAEPWLPLNPDWPTRNIAAQEGDPESMLILYRALLALRRAHPALAIGAVDEVADEGDVLSYQRLLGDEHYVIALNLGDRPNHVSPVIDQPMTVLLSTHMERGGSGVIGANGPIPLKPNEGLILKVAQ